MILKLLRVIFEVTEILPSYRNTAIGNITATISDVSEGDYYLIIISVSYKN